MNKFLDIKTFKSHLSDNLTIMVGGFMTVGTPEELIDALVESNVRNLTIICNDAGLPDKGVGKLIANNQVKKLIASHIGLNPNAGALMSEGKMEVELVPQGTLAERIRAFGAGLGGVLTKTGIGTIVENNKQKLTVNNSEYLIEMPLGADMALLHASRADAWGNIYYHGTTRNFNPLMATAAKKVFAYAREIVENLDPDAIMTPHVFVHYIVKGDVNG